MQNSPEEPSSEEVEATATAEWTLSVIHVAHRKNPSDTQWTNPCVCQEFAVVTLWVGRQAVSLWWERHHLLACVFFKRPTYVRTEVALTWGLLVFYFWPVDCLRSQPVHTLTVYAGPSSGAVKWSCVEKPPIEKWQHCLHKNNNCVTYKIGFIFWHWTK